MWVNLSDMSHEIIGHVEACTRTEASARQATVAHHSRERRYRIIQQTATCSNQDSERMPATYGSCFGRDCCLSAGISINTSLSRYYDLPSPMRRISLVCDVRLTGMRWQHVG